MPVLGTIDDTDTATAAWARLELPLPKGLVAGSVTVIYLAGRAMDGERPVRGLTLLLDDVRHPVANCARPRFDAPELRSGFWAAVPVRIADDATELVIAAELVGTDGPAPPIELVRLPVEPPPARATPAVDPRLAPIVVCLATHNPDPGLLASQIESLRTQTDTNWTCVICDDHSEPERYATLLEVVGDDPRFAVSTVPYWIGFYRNFERALKQVPADAPVVALCDQDDFWHPDKLATLRANLGSAVLVYSDQRLVGEDGRLLRETMWVGRANNHTNMASMVVANTITGASMLFSRAVLDAAVPFPDCPGMEFHDHWLAMVALAAGGIGYVDRPLYDYVQHRRALLGGDADPVKRRWTWIPRPDEWRGAYFLVYLGSQMRAQTLLLRCEDTLSARDRRALRLFVAADSSLLAFAWLVCRPIRMPFGHNETLGSEWELASGIAWRWLAAFLANVPRWPNRWLLDTSFPKPFSFGQRRLGRWRDRI